MVILFMIKPLFSRRPKSVEPRRLKREEEPELFEFINQISDLVGSPRPKRVQVDLQVNASAALTHGFWSLFTRNLTLTIGLPLAGGCRPGSLAACSRMNSVILRRAPE
jgi:hypothetical protein